MIPIFICGYQKSGTTLLSALLDGHPDFAVFPEETSFYRWIRSKTFDSKEALSNFLFEKTHLNRLSLIDHTHPEEGYRNYKNFPYLDFKQEIINTIKSSVEQGRVFKQIINSYAHHSHQNHKTYFVEKTPRNELYTTMILKDFPSAQFIYIIRDPRDAYNSYKKNRTIFLKGKGTLTLDNFLNKWMESILELIHLHQSNIPFAFLRFEDLLTNPQRTLTTLCKKFNTAFHRSLLTPTKFNIDWNGNSMHQESYNNISTKPINRWKNNISLEEDFNTIEIVLYDILDIFGYETIDKKRNSLNIIRKLLTKKGNRKQLLSNWFKLIHQKDTCQAIFHNCIK